MPTPAVSKSLTRSVMLLESAHTSDPSFDPAMALFKANVGMNWYAVDAIMPLLAIGRKSPKSNVRMTAPRL